MPLDALIAELRTKGIRLGIDDDQLTVKAPKGVMTAELAAELRLQKMALLDYLRQAKQRTQTQMPHIAVADACDRLKLSDGQRRLWFLDQLEGPSPTYNMPIAVRIKGNISASDVQRALIEIASRHETLRTRFVNRDDEVSLSIDATPQLTLLSQTADPSHSIDAQIAHAVRQASLVRFDLAKDHAVRAWLVCLSDGSYLLVLTLHHIIADGWSLANLVREFANLYVDGTDALAPLTIQYADYVAWQASRLTSTQKDAALHWWRNHLAHAPDLITLPLDFPRPSVMQYRGQSLKIVLAPDLNESIKAFALSQDATPYMVMLCAFAILLQRHAGIADSADLVIGTTTANRPHPDLEPLIGLFINMLALRVEVDPAQTVTNLLRQVKSVCLDANAHQDIAFEQVVEALNPIRSLSHSPLFQVTFDVQNAPEMSLVLPGLTLEPVEPELTASKFDLSVSIEHDADSSFARWTWNTDLFARGTIERLANQYQQLLSQLIDHPEWASGRLRLLDAQQVRAQVVAQQATEKPTASTCWLTTFEHHVETAGHRLAISDGQQSLTYLALRERALTLASVLRSHGVGPEDRVCVLLHRRTDLVISLLAVQYAGAAYVPLDPSYPAQRLAWVFEDADPIAVVTEIALLNRVLPGRAKVVQIDQLATVKTPTAVTDNWTLPGANSLAYVIFTSGSTGRPKGVQIEHGALNNFLVSMAREPGLKADDVLLAVTTISFDIAALELYLPLMVGAHVVLADRDTTIDGQALIRQVREHRITCMQATPSTWRLMLDSGWTWANSLRILCGGEALPRDLSNRLQAIGAEVWNLYGPTETTIWSAALPVSSLSDDLTVSTEPIGAGIDNTQLYVLDAFGELVPQGIAGELWIGGHGLARGYLHRPGQTAERYRPDPFSAKAGARLYGTGDLVKAESNGTFTFLGRLDGQVKLRGFRIELGEIESVLRQQPDVTQAVVLVVGQGAMEKRLVAYVQTSLDVALASPKWRSALQSSLPSYMVPSQFMTLEKLPLTPNGKIDRKALLALDTKPTAAALEHHAPDTATEEKISQLWRQSLKSQAIDIDTNFFDAGGHSLLLAQIHGRLQSSVAPSLTLVALFQYPTIRSLAKHVESIATAQTNQPSQQISQRLAPGADSAIAIIGMACRFPGAPDLDNFWQLLQSGETGIQFFSKETMDAAGIDATDYNASSYVPAHGAIEDIECFDASFFGYRPAQAKLIDPQQRLFLETAWHTLEHAGYAHTARNPNIGVFAGCGQNDYLIDNVLPSLQRADGVSTYEAILGAEKDFIATRVSYTLNLTGPSVNVQTACSTSLVAVHMAAQSLIAGECDMAIAGGIALRVPQTVGHHYQDGMITSPDGHCRPFDANAKGTVWGSGSGAVLLKPLAQAIADGDTIHAVIRGSAINNDGAQKVGFTAPSVEGQSTVIERALASAGLTPKDISYVESHGTATALGDLVEIAALKKVWGPISRESCAIGALKSQIGHLNSAAGIAGLIKATLAIKHGKIPGNPWFETPHPDLELSNSPFSVPQTTHDWSTSESGLRCAGVSSFGIGGTNAHVILQQAPDLSRPVQPSPDTPQVLTLSAQTMSALSALRDAVVANLSQIPQPLHQVANTLALGRKPMPYRMAVVATTPQDGAELLRTADPYHVSERSKLVWLFPGQGSQHIGMGQSLYDRWPIFQQSIDTCAQALAPLIGHDLRDMFDPERAAQNNLSDKLGQTWLTQPALFSMSYAQAKLWQSWGVEPAALLGHSLGEYVAACLAGVFDLATALRLVALRGQLIWQQPRGAMLAIGQPADTVNNYLSQPRFIELDLAAVNGPNACVVAGACDGIEALATLLSQQDVACKRLNTSHAFHSKMLEPAKQAFAMLVANETLCAPTTPVISNVTGTWLQPEQAMDPAYWSEHLLAPVQFAKGLQTLSDWQPSIWLEVGPGQVLSNLTRQQINTGGLCIATGSTAASMLGGMSKLWREYDAVDAARCVATETTSIARAPLALYPFDRQRHWIDPEKIQTTTSVGRQAIDDWFYLPYWQPSVAAARQPVEAGEWHLDGFKGTWAAKIGEYICANRGATHVEVNGSLSPKTHDIEAFAATGIVRLIIAANPTAEASTFNRVLSWVRTWNEQRPVQELHLTILTQPIELVVDSDQFNAREASLRGAVLVVAQEFPAIHISCIDIAEGPAGIDARLLTAIDTELGAPKRLPFISLRGNRRYLPALESVPLSANDAHQGLRQGGVYLITGGLGNMGMGIARYLIDRVQASVILTARHLPAPGDMRHQALQALGPRAMAYAVDAADLSGMCVLIDQIERQQGPLSGVFHAAGQQHWQAISETDHAAEQKLLGAKLQGLQVLAQALADRQIDFCVTMSSISAVLGGIGYAHYSAANAAMDAFVQQIHQQTGRNWLSIGWDAWRFDATGDADWIDVQEGVEALVRILGVMPCPRVLVSTTPLPNRIQRWVLDVSRIPKATPTTKAAPSAANEVMTASEATICQVWQSALGYPSIGLDDDYFELGGDSMLAIRIVEMLRTEFGRNIPMTALLEYPSVRQLANVLSDETKLNDSLLVKLNASKSDATIYLLPGTGGSVLYLNDLARELERLGWACLGLQASGLDGEQTPHDTIEAIARDNIKSLMTRQPEGPYTLIGHSLGSWIAYEMACQLQRLGQQVKRVLILDTAAPGPRKNEEMYGWGNEQWLLSVANNVGRVWDIDFGISLDDLASLSWSQQITWLHRATIDHGILPSNSHENLVRGIVQVFRTQAMIQYQPQPKAVSPLTLIRAQQRLPEFLEGIPQALINDDTWGWQPFSSSPVDVEFVQGNHLNMVSRDNAAELAGQLQKYLTITDEITP